MQTITQKADDGTVIKYFTKFDYNGREMVAAWYPHQNMGIESNETINIIENDDYRDFYGSIKNPAADHEGAVSAVEQALSDWVVSASSGGA